MKGERPKKELLKRQAVLDWLEISAYKLRIYCEMGLLKPLQPRKTSRRQYRRSEIETNILGK